MEIQQKNEIRGREAEAIREEYTTITTNTDHQLQSKETISSTPSASSSPSHEFSFTISLLSSSTATNPNKDKSQQHPLAIDLTPADDIFLHGQLLPLQLLPPVSPRSSTNSLDSFTLPVREVILDEGKPHNIHSCICSDCDRITKRHSFNSYEYNSKRSCDMNEAQFPTKERVKSKSFSLFGRARRRKEGESKGAEDQGGKQKKKLKFDVGHFLKKYTSMFSRGRREDVQFRKQSYSFSGKMTSREGRRDFKGSRGEFSAPASMRTSPSNSGTLVATSRVPRPPSSDSTMEELQAAIQAAIAHCKNSNAVAEKLNTT